ncbi:MAG: FAD-binding oxidoreductase [Steroidobacteraceae bacterium]|nr:FAD-binding oxidoreductase [Steroidobacteraceae bacterium]
MPRSPASRASRALHLAEAGVSVAVIEARQPGWGASGRNAGHVLPTLRDASVFETFPDQGQRFLDAFAEHHTLPFDLPAKHGFAADATKSGYINAGGSAEDIARFRGQTAWMEERGLLTVVELGGEELRKATGGAHWSHALVYPDGGRADAGAGADRPEPDGRGRARSNGVVVDPPGGRSGGRAVAFRQPDGLGPRHVAGNPGDGDRTGSLLDGTCGPARPPVPRCVRVEAWPLWPDALQRLGQRHGPADGQALRRGPGERPHGRPALPAGKAGGSRQSGQAGPDHPPPADPLRPTGAALGDHLTPITATSPGPERLYVDGWLALIEQAWDSSAVDCRAMPRTHVQVDVDFRRDCA